MTLAIGIFIAVVLATVYLMVLSTASKALYGAVLAHLRLNHMLQPFSWMKSSELTFVFGGFVYGHLRVLVQAGLVEVRTVSSPPDGPRGGRPSYWYRWKANHSDRGGGDQISNRLMGGELN